MNTLRRFLVSTLWAATLVAAGAAAAEPQPRIEVYKNPYCGCCEQWAAHLRASGFKVDVKTVADVAPLRRGLGMHDRYVSCHTAWIAGTSYVVEGHVPASDIRRLLRDKPAALGLAVPGMPASAPGMDGPVPTPYETLLVQRDGSSRVYASHR